LCAIESSLPCQSLDQALARLNGFRGPNRLLIDGSVSLNTTLVITRPIIIGSASADISVTIDASALSESALDIQLVEPTTTVLLQSIRFVACHSASFLLHAHIETLE
jgi:hypothetical protein